nr:mechanosensitive ion channel family protein [Qipengyuania algicida]
MAAGAVQLLPNIVIGVVLLVATAIMVRVFVNVVEKVTGRSRMRADLRQLAQTLTRVFVWILGLLLVTTIIIPGFTFGSAMAGLGVGAVAIGFAFQDILENFLAGVLIMLRDKMHLGDYIEANNIDGTVEKITLRETHIRQFSGELTILPNSTIFKNPVKIYSDRPFRRFQLTVGVSYDTDLTRARKVIANAVKTVEGVDGDHASEVYLREFGGSSIDLLVRWWVDTKQNSLMEVQSNVVNAIKEALDQAEIEIPFPYITHTFKERVPLGKEPGETVESAESA